MYGRWLTHTAGTRPIPETTAIRVQLRNGVRHEGVAANFAWGEMGQVSIQYYAIQVPGTRDEVPVPRHAAIRVRDDLAETEPEQPTETDTTEMSRCLPDGFLWGDEFTPEVATTFINKYKERHGW